jgi:YidC/Oxa1 family membrane protein insertase
MFTTLLVKPIFNILVTIYAIIPGHNFGIALLLFTILTRIVLYPLLKKQLKHTKAMRDLQPELKKIKKAANGNRQQESIMMMELYKEKEIKPLAQIGLMVVQIAIFLALFSGLNRIVKNQQEVINFSYEPVQSLPWMQELSNDITKFDNTFLGQIDLSRPAYGTESGLYLPAFVLVLGSAIIQFFQIKQTMPSQKDNRKLREILKDANKDGKAADSSEVNAAMGRSMVYFMPIMIFVLTIGFAAALSFYWFVGGLIAFLQQNRLLKDEEYNMQQATAVVVSKKTLTPEKATPKSNLQKTKNNKKKAAKKRNKRRR